MAVVLTAATLAARNSDAVVSKPSAKGVPQTADTGKMIYPRAFSDGITENLAENGRGIFHGEGRCFQCHGKMAPAQSSHQPLTTGTPFISVPGVGRHYLSTSYLS